MKKWVGFTLFSLAVVFTACDQGTTREEQSVIETDTVGMEYEVEKTVKEKTVDVDTTTETETIERDLEDQPENGL